MTTGNADTPTLWPDTRCTPSLTAFQQQLLPHATTALEHLPAPWLSQWSSVWSWVAAWVAEQKHTTSGIPVIGIHGGQGSGKSTLSQALACVFREAYQWNTVVVSIDDLYLGHQDRLDLAQQSHPLLATRGVPGTHDHQLGMALFTQLQQLKQGETLAIPRFDKVSDDRLPESGWHQVHGPVDLILFEGWCVGCQAVAPEELEQPINSLEAREDADKRWRTEVNNALSNDYKIWFGMMDHLIMLQVPGMDAVFNWRKQQEADNRKHAKGDQDRSMDDAALARFIQHYERLTRNALRDLPQQADLVLALNQQHAVSGIELPA